MKKSMSFIICICLLLALTACGNKITAKEVGDLLKSEGLEVFYGDQMNEEYYDYTLNEKVKFLLFFEKDAEGAKKTQEQYKDSKYNTFIVNNNNVILYYYQNKNVKADPNLEAKIANFIVKFDATVKDK
ncbi:hypothetical protein [Paenibacillus herberti]|uniref:Uncharacterized protein n=1 Tax=Paenibacillus herberti TaxID=1619309 RepID=A0A229NX77_9BACL|nr:hypothetical protein [Paenibacillus herberti]OXM14375.1 hypothetical protein CGZ75_15625 [Paenibacillus herberti]